MLKKIIIYITFCGALFQCGWALTINTDYTLNGGPPYPQDIIIQGDGITVTLKGSVDIEGKFTVIGTGRGVNIVCEGGKWMITVRDDIYLKNATLDINRLESKYSSVGNKIYIEKTKITAGNTALYAANSIIRARFSTFISTGAYPAVELFYSNNTAAFKNPIFEFCYFQTADTNKYGLDTGFYNVTAADWTFDLEGSCFSSRKYPSNGASYDNSPAGTAYNTTTPDPVNGILKVSFSNPLAGTTSGVHFDKIIPSGTTLAASGTLPAGRKLRLGYNEDTSAYEGGAALICTPSLTVVGEADAASSVGDEFHSGGAAAKPNEIQGGMSLTLYGKQHTVIYTNFSNLSSYALRNYASNVTIQNNNFGSGIGDAVRNYGASTIVQNNVFSAGVSTYALRSYDAATNSNYSNNTFNTTAAGLDISTNGTLTIQNNTFSSSTRSSAPLRIRAGNAIVTGNTFYAADATDLPVAAVRVDSGNPSFTNNTISYTSGTGVRVDGGRPSFTGNTITGNNSAVPASGLSPTAVDFRGGTPNFRQNNIGGYANGRALALNDSSAIAMAITGVNFSQNNFNNPNPLVYSGGTGPYIVENNYWGAATPASANFGGSTGAVDYEPWLNAPYPGGTASYKKAEPVMNISPKHQSSLSDIPAAVSFRIDDLGYHNGTPLQYEFRIADSAAGLGTVTTLVSSNWKAGSTVQQPVSGLIRGKTYYWQARVQNTTDYQGFSDWPVYQFSINEPRLRLDLSAWDTLVGNTQVTQRSAGEAVYYRHAFKNEEYTAVIGPATITTILPDDVYWNGELRVTGLNTGNGSITVKAYENIDGSGAAKTYSAALSGDTNLTYASLSISQSDVYKYRRFELTVSTLPVNSGGTFTYGAVVK